MSRQAEVSVQFYQEKLEANSQSLVFSRLADCYRKKGEIQQAIGVCMQGLQIHPDYVTGRVILGRCYLEQEKLKEATAEFVRVVELDRRNQVAVKMIADLYARQGMKEKAGDLYAYLLRMDPENQSLARLSQQNRGNGETNVLRILGIAQQSQMVSFPDGSEQEAAPPLPPEASQTSFDTIVDADKTIQMDYVSKQPEGRINDTAQLGEMLIKTQKFDAEELNAAPEAASYRVEETISDIGAPGAPQAGSVGDAITGDDVSSRMSMIFGEEGAGLEAAPPSDEAMAIVPDDTEVRAVRDDTVAADSLAGKETAAAPVVSGSDITSRIEQLFGDEGNTAPGTGVLSDFTQPYTPQSAPAPEVEATVGVSEAPQLGQTTLRKDISGDDVTQRLNEMFSDSSTDSIAEPLAEIGRMLDQHAPAIDEIEPTQAGSEMHDDLPTESIVLSATAAADGPLDVPELVHGESTAAISGDDIALRLETIFEEGERTEEASASAAAAPEDTAAREESFPAALPETRPEEDTRPPVEVSDHAIVIGGDLSDTDIHDVGEATLFGAETLTESSTVQDEENVPVAETDEEEMNIDDAVPQDEHPEMSGDDVVGRLDELFSDTLLGSGDAESIPEGDRDDDVVNQGFYTMSGENAQTAASEDTLLSELDKSENEGIRKDAADIASEAVDRTEIMDQDGGDVTLAAIEEETILSDQGEQAAQPVAEMPQVRGASPEDSDDVVVDGATQISLPTADEPVLADADAEAQYSIPDHVLTPTLADIYYQQGQPKLALQIYNRLLEADPDNDSLAKRIQQIKDYLASQESGETAMMDSERKNPAPIRPETTEEPAPVRKKADNNRKPLSGVRIKKVFKSRIKKSR
jgi:tetratricopeptide (TPR) repeat protein